MTDSHYSDYSRLLVENDTPIAHSQPGTSLALQLFDVTLTSRRKCLQFLADTVANLW